MKIKNVLPLIALVFSLQAMAQTTEFYKLSIEAAGDNKFLLSTGDTEATNPLLGEKLKNCKNHIQAQVDVEESKDLQTWNKIERINVDAKSGFEIEVTKDQPKMFWRTRLLGFKVDADVHLRCMHEHKGKREIMCFKGQLPPGIEKKSDPGFCPDTPFTIVGTVAPSGGAEGSRTGAGH